MRTNNPSQSDLLRGLDQLLPSNPGLLLKLSNTKLKEYLSHNMQLSIMRSQSMSIIPHHETIIRILSHIVFHVMTPFHKLDHHRKTCPEYLSNILGAYHQQNHREIIDRIKETNYKNLKETRQYCLKILTKNNQLLINLLTKLKYNSKRNLRPKKDTSYLSESVSPTDWENDTIRQLKPLMAVFIKKEWQLQRRDANPNLEEFVYYWSNEDYQTAVILIQKLHPNEFYSITEFLKNKKDTFKQAIDKLTSTLFEINLIVTNFSEWIDQSPTEITPTFEQPLSELRSSATSTEKNYELLNKWIYERYPLLSSIENTSHCIGTESTYIEKSSKNLLETLSCVQLHGLNFYITEQYQSLLSVSPTFLTEQVVLYKTLSQSYLDRLIVINEFIQSRTSKHQSKMLKKDIKGIIKQLRQQTVELTQQEAMTQNPSFDVVLKKNTILALFKQQKELIHCIINTQELVIRCIRNKQLKHLSEKGSFLNTLIEKSILECTPRGSQTHHASNRHNLLNSTNKTQTKRKEIQLLEPNAKRHEASPSSTGVII